MPSDKGLKKNKRLIYFCLAAVFCMFGFAFALVPLYSVFCDVTGINGKTMGPQVAQDITGIDMSRTVTLEFVANNNAQLPWDFFPETASIKLHPGEFIKTQYYAKNNTAHEMTVQAVPSVSPGLAAKYVKKLECFCFKQQTVAAHTSRWMPIQLTIDPELPTEIKTLSLSYTLFDVNAAHIQEREHVDHHL